MIAYTQATLTYRRIIVYEIQEPSSTPRGGAQLRRRIGTLRQETDDGHDGTFIGSDRLRGRKWRR